MTAITTAAAAADYAAELGWRVFLVARDCRTPIKGQGFEHGVHDATDDPAELRRRFALHPHANLALACGAGLLALDIDAKGGVDGFAALAELEAEFEPLPVTARSSTPSGGAHLLFSYTGPSPLNRVGLKRWNAAGVRRVYDGLDVRAEGASVCLPPSRKPSGPYAWDASPFDVKVAPAPAWLMALFRSQPPPRPPAAPIRIGSVDRLARYAAAAVNRECEALAACRAPGRNLKLFQASANLGELVAARMLPQEVAEAALERAAEECGLIREDGPHAVRATIGSGMSRGLRKPREVA